VCFEGGRHLRQLNFLIVCWISEREGNEAVFAAYVEVGVGKLEQNGEQVLGPCDALEVFNKLVLIGLRDLVRGQEFGGGEDSGIGLQLEGIEFDLCECGECEASLIVGVRGEKERK